MSDPAARRMCATADTAYRAGRYRDAAALWRQVRLQDAGDARLRTKSLFWEGGSLYLAGAVEEALVPLLEAVASDAPEVDPADVYNARISVIGIAMVRKPASYARRLLDDARVWLGRTGHDAWSHTLDQLLGALEMDRAAFEEAHRAFLRAWGSYTGKYPSYTRASLLKALCRSSFRLRDAEALGRWCALLQENKPKVDADRVSAKDSLVLLARASAAGRRLPSPAVDECRSGLRLLASMDGNRRERQSLYRGLMLGGCFTEAAAALDHIKPVTVLDRLELILFRGDLNLQRARAALGQDPIDDDWCDAPPLPAPGSWDTRLARARLDEAHHELAAAVDIAAAEDTRLETTFHTTRLGERQRRIARLRELVGGET